MSVVIRGTPSEYARQSSEALRVSTLVSHQRHSECVCRTGTLPAAWTIASASGAGVRGLDGRRGPAAIGEVIRESSARRHQASSGVIRCHQVSSGVIKHLLFGDPHAMYVRPGWRGGGRERNGAVAMRGCSGHGVGKGAEMGAETGAGHACARYATETQSASQSDRLPGRTARQTLRQIARQPLAERGTASQPQLASQAAKQPAQPSSQPALHSQTGSPQVFSN
jgi:hypothetical protein